MEKANTQKLLLCPFCKEDIPDLSLILQNNTILLLVRCSCSPMENPIELEEFMARISSLPLVTSKCEKHNYFQQNLYCSTCAISWLCLSCLKSHLAIPNKKHIIVSNAKLHLVCDKHHKDYTDYCSKCYTNICQDCKTHKAPNHHMIKREEPIAFSSLRNDINALFEQNKEVNRKLIEEFTQKMIKENLTHVSMKEKLMKLAHHNDEMNELLKDFYEHVHYTAITAAEYSTYPLIRLINTLEINQKKNTRFPEALTIEVMHKQLTEYFNGYLILKQKNLYQCITTLHQYNTHIINVFKLNEDTFISITSDYSSYAYNIHSFKYKHRKFDMRNQSEKMDKCILLNDGRLLTIAFDGTVDYWELQTLQKLKSLKTSIQYLVGLLQLNDNCLLYWKHDSTIYICDVDACRIVFLHTNINVIACVIQLKDNRLVAGLDQSHIHIYEAKSFQLKTSLSYGDPLTSTSSLIQLNEAQIASGHSDSLIRIWSLQTLICLHVLNGTSGTVNHLAVVNGNCLASYYLQGVYSIRIWDLAALKCTAVMKKALLYTKGFIQLSNQLLASFGSADIRIWLINDEEGYDIQSIVNAKSEESS